MVGTESLFANRQGALVERLRGGVIATVAERARVVEERDGDRGMLGTERLFPYRQRSNIQGVGVGITLLLAMTDSLDC